MSLLFLAKTNIVVTNRESVNAIASYVLYVLMGFILVGLALVPVFTTNSNTQVYLIALFISFLFLYDYVLINAKLRGLSLIDRFAFSPFPISRTRSLSLRLFLFLSDKRFIFYLMPFLGMVVVLARQGKFAGIFVMFLLFSAMYLVTSEIFFLFYTVLRKLANRFGARMVTQFSGVSFLLLPLLLNALSRGRTGILTMVPVVSQSITAFQAILASQFNAALIETGYLFVFACGIALAVPAAGSLYDKTENRLRLQIALSIDRRTEKKPASPDVKVSGTGRTSARVGDKTSVAHETPFQEDPISIPHIGWNLASMDWLVHQREEKIIYLLLLYPLMMIFAIVRIISRLHFEPGSLIFPIFLLTQILGFYFTENHFTAHGLRLTHIVLTSLNLYKFVFAKTISTWGLLSLMNVFVCVFCGVYLNMKIYIMAQGIIYSLFLPLVLLQLANSLSLYLPETSRHPLISLIIIILSELALTAAFVLTMLFSLIVGTLLVSAIFYLSYVWSLPAWGKQLSKQLQILLEYQK